MAQVVKSFCMGNNFRPSFCTINTTPDIKVHGANIGPIWCRQDTGGPHVGSWDHAIWDSYYGLATQWTSAIAAAIVFI